MKSMANSRVWTSAVLCVLLLAGAAGASALPPQDAKHLPLYPGVHLLRSTVDGASSDFAYTADAAPGKVCAFYLGSFGWRPEQARTDFVPVAFWQPDGGQCMIFFKENAAQPSTFPWTPGVAMGGILSWESEDGKGNHSSFNMKITDTTGSAPSTEIDLSVITVNRGEVEAQQAAVADQGQKVAAAMEEGVNHVDPVQKKLVDDWTAHPPTMKDLAARIKKEYGLALYPGVTLQLKAMELYEYDILGGWGGYWFLSTDPPEKLVAWYAKALGKSVESIDADAPADFVITDAQNRITGHVGIYKGTTALNLGQEPEDADPDQVLNVTTLGFFRGHDVGTLAGSEGGR